MKRISFSVVIIIALLVCVSQCKRKEKESVGAVKTQETAIKAEPQIQEPIVAGSFYPANPDTLRTMINRFLDSAEPKDIAGKPFGFMVPHAGYEYSGPVSAYAYKVIKNSGIKRFVIMAPSHHEYAEVASVLDKDYYRTPLGLVKIDRKKVAELIGKKTWLTYEPALFDYEHSLEVQIPFLQVVVGNDLEIVPLVIGTPKLDFAQKLAVVLDRVFPKDEVIFIASSDMSHDYPYDIANQMDSLALSRMLNMDINQLEADFSNQKAACCGAGPIFTLMSLFERRSGKLVEVLDHRNSGDIVGDKMSRIVGYGAVAFILTGNEKPKEIQSAPEESERETRLIPPENYDLTMEEKKELMDIAKQTVEMYVRENMVPNFTTNSAKLKEKGAAFVTLKEQGQLRGCIGHLVAQEPLYLCVRDMAASAAKHDMRFKPVTLEEIPLLQYEISVLTPMQKITSLDEIMVGRDGLEMEYGPYRGVLLPQVPLEYNWTKEEFLSHTCNKAGMELDCFKNSNVRISKFQALVFSENDLK